MSKFFECVRCGEITPVEVAPPKCRGCGHGTGILHMRDPRGSSQDTGAKNGSSAGLPQETPAADSQ